MPNPPKSNPYSPLVFKFYFDSSHKPNTSGDMAILILISLHLESDSDFDFGHEQTLP